MRPNGRPKPGGAHGSRTASVSWAGTGSRGHRRSPIGAGLPTCSGSSWERSRWRSRAWHRDNPTRFEQQVFEAFNSLPDSLTGFGKALYQLGTLWAVGLVVVAGLLARRWRLARDLSLAGLAAWLIGQLLADVVGDEALPASIDIVVRTGAGPEYPLVRLAVITAIIAAAAPYLSRPSRFLGFAAVVVVALDAMYLGVGSPADVVGALALGISVAGAVHLAFGSPGGRPTTQQVALALSVLGVDVDNVRLAPEQTLGRTLMLADAPDGPLDVTVLGRDERDAQFAAKAWRFVMYRDSGPTLFRSRLQEVEHEAYVLLRAAREGVRVPELVEVGQAGPDAAVLVTRAVGGRRLADVPVAEVTSDGARGHLAFGGQVAGGGDRPRKPRRRARHGARRRRVAFTGLRAASSASSAGRLGGDVAALLFSTASIVGDERADRRRAGRARERGARGERPLPPARGAPS